MKSKKAVGFYVVLEGVDFSGKSTLAKKVVDILIKKYGKENIEHKREPSYENYGAKMREVLMSGDMTEADEILAAQYMLLDRIENTSNVAQSLRKNKIIIQERNFLTALVYNEALDTEEVKFIQTANRLSLKPDYLLLVTVSESTLAYRLEKAAVERGRLDDYETFDKISKRRKDYYKFSDHISSIVHNDHQEDIEENTIKLLKIIAENYTPSISSLDESSMSFKENICEDDWQ